MAMRNKKKSVDVYQIITQRIIEKLESGMIPWKKPWHSHGTPKNYLTKKPYRGINLLLLGMSCYPAPYFLTFKQAQKLGGSVKRGSISEIVVFWQMRYYDEQSKSWKNASQESSIPQGSKIIPMLRYYRVFNIHDIEGIDYTFPPRAELQNDLQLDDLEAGYLPVRAIPKLTLKSHCHKACYSPRMDTIFMPSITDFKTTSGYFEVLYHELTHAVGSAERLARSGITGAVNKRSERYAKEELIAELGSCFLMNHFGFQQEATLENSAAYIEFWLGRLRNDKKLIVEAAAEAQKATDYILQRIQEYKPVIPDAA